jgi:hypothetical protein
MACAGGVSALAFKNPCLVGENLSGQGGTGFHVTECRIAQDGEPVAWSFILPLATLAQSPGTVLHFPGDLPSPPPPFGSVQLNGESAHATAVTGALTFSRVDPASRAFVGAFHGTVVWTIASGSQISCQVDGPLWGAPGGFT